MTVNMMTEAQVLVAGYPWSLSWIINSQGRSILTFVFVKILGLSLSFWRGGMP